VISVTGVKSRKAADKLAFHCGDQLGVERIARPACQPLGGRPEMAEIVDDLGLSGCGREDERGALPVG
jgi:hypothetical protein